MTDVEKLKNVRYGYGHQQISNGHVGDEGVGWAAHVVYRTDDINYQNVTDQRNDKNQYREYGDSDLNIWRYGIKKTSTARFRGVVGNVRKHRYCEEK